LQGARRAPLYAWVRDDFDKQAMLLTVMPLLPSGHKGAIVGSQYRDYGLLAWDLSSGDAA